MQASEPTRRGGGSGGQAVRGRLPPSCTWPRAQLAFGVFLERLALGPLPFPPGQVVACSGLAALGIEPGSCASRHAPPSTPELAAQRPLARPSGVSWALHTWCPRRALGSPLWLLSASPARRRHHHPYRHPGDAAPSPPPCRHQSLLTYCPVTFQKGVPLCVPPRVQPRPLPPVGHAAAAHQVPTCRPAPERSRLRRAISRHGKRDAAPSLVRGAPRLPAQ